MDKRKLATGIVRKLRREGFAAYFVGGCVRDMLMRKIVKDVDIATEAKLSQIEKLFPGRTHRVGARFSTLLVVKNSIPFQDSTFRSRDKNRPLSLVEDVQARDFSINGLAYEPIKGELIDLVGAKSDIRKKRICSIGGAHAAFSDDPLRLIRAVRFAVTLGFSIEPKTLQAIKKKARMIKKVSAERIRDELTLIFTGPNPSAGLKLLDKACLLKHILPEVDKLKGVKQPAAFHPEGDVFRHTLLMLKQVKNPSLVLAFACLLHDIGKPATFQRRERIRFSGHDRVGARISEKILRRLRFSNNDREDIVACVQNHMRITAAPKMRRATLIRMLARPTFEVELRLHRIDCAASHKDLTLWRFLNRRYRQFKNRPLIPRPILNGYELIKIGFTPGPIFGKIHRRMQDLQLEGKLSSKSAAKKWVVDNFKKRQAND